jgi:hypothetical protein
MWHYCCNFSALSALLQAASWGTSLACCDCHQHLIHSALQATSINLDCLFYVRLTVHHKSYI